MNTLPIWSAVPPEVHSALLNAGSGPAGWVGATTAWRSLAGQYDAAAAELTGILDMLRAGAWAGPTAEAYHRAHQPYLAWLEHNGAAASAAATRLEAVTAAHAAALAAMPTPAELVANHLAHAILLGTNFFGVNTLPIAHNEADYLRMWLQAAAVMAGYQSAAAAATTTHTPFNPAPSLLRTTMNHDSPARHRHRSTSAAPLMSLTGGGALLFMIAYNVVPWPLPFYLGPAAAIALPIALGIGMALLSRIADAPSGHTADPTAPAVGRIDTGRPRTIPVPAAPTALTGGPIPGNAPGAAAPTSAGLSAPTPGPGLEYLVTAGAGPGRDAGPALPDRDPLRRPTPSRSPVRAPAAESGARSRRARAALTGPANEYTEATALQSSRSGGRLGFTGALAPTAPAGLAAPGRQKVPLLPAQPSSRP